MKAKLKSTNTAPGGMYNVTRVQFLCWSDMYSLLRWYPLHWKFGGAHWWTTGCQVCPMSTEYSSMTPYRAPYRESHAMAMSNWRKVDGVMRKSMVSANLRSAGEKVLHSEQN